MVLAAQTPKQTQETRAAIAAGLTALCEWAVNAVKAPIPPAIYRRAAMVISDDIAAIVAASTEPQVQDAQTLVLKGGGQQEASVFGPKRARGTREQAAAANGVAITWAELDEGYRPLPCHAGAYIVPALLAEAEAEDASVDEVVATVAVAYEVTTRIAQTFPFPRLTGHPHGVFNAIGAGAALALLRGYDARTLYGVLTSAATMVAVGPFNHAIEGALVRNIWTSIGATAGFRAADFAPLGITGLDGALYDVYADCLGCDVRTEQLTQGLGGAVWQIESGYHKMHACCQYMHAAVEASIELAKRLPANGGKKLQGIEVETHARGLALSVREPDTVLAAKFSMPHTLAAVAALGSAGPKSFEYSTLKQPEISELRSKVSLVPHAEVGPFPNDRPARVHWTFDDGTKWSAECINARGGADQPFSEGELFTKFQDLTVGVYPAAGGLLRRFVQKASDVPASWGGFLRQLTA
jgi:2-methylcitrate dehydratase PrpD